MQLTKTISATFIEKKRVDYQLWRKYKFCGEKKLNHLGTVTDSSSRRSTFYVRQPVLVQQVSSPLALEDAEDHRTVNSRRRVLLCINCWSWCLVAWQPFREYGLCQQAPTLVYEDTDNTACIEWGNNVIGGRGRAKHIDIQKHFAHDVIQNGYMRLILSRRRPRPSWRISRPRAYTFRNDRQCGRYCGQEVCNYLRNIWQEVCNYLRNICPQEGVLSPTWTLSSRVT